MSNIEEIVSKLEQSIRDTEDEIRNETASMPNEDTSGVSRQPMIDAKYILIAIPILVLLLMYFIKPKFVLKDAKTKELSYGKFFGYSILIIAVFYGILFLLSKYNIVNI